MHINSVKLRQFLLNCSTYSYTIVKYVQINWKGIINSFNSLNIEEMERDATAAWLGTGKEGKGTLTTQSKVLNEAFYSSASRFEQAKGTNPEELVAAAHAGCFTMKLAYLIDAAGFFPERLETGCKVTLEDGSIKKSHLTVKAQIKGITKEKFDELVKDAEINCPISKSINAKISVEAALS